MREINFHPSEKETVLLNNPPIPASKGLPDWYKKLESIYGTRKDKWSYPPQLTTVTVTIKRCVPFLDALTMGYLITTDEDIYVDFSEHTGGFRWKTNQELVNAHNPDQLSSFPIPKGYKPIAFKFTNFWEIQTPKGYSCLFTHPLNRLDLPFITLSGVVDTDVYPIEVNFPFFIKDDFEGVIPAGTPIAQVIPIKRETWQSQTMNLDEDRRYVNWRKFTKLIAASYRKQYWVKKDYR